MAGVYNQKWPLVGMSIAEMREWCDNNVRNDPVIQKRLVLIIVSVALLLDNMLYMVIVPIIPIYFRETEVYEKYNETIVTVRPDGSMHTEYRINYKDEEELNGWLFASKAIVQICVGPFAGHTIDRIGYELPMVLGLCVMFVSTTVFALGSGYWLMLLARSFQGLGSAFADTAGLSMIADRFQDEEERSKALGIAIAFISFGCLVAPPFGGTLYEMWGKSVPFLILSVVCLMDGFMVYMVIQPKRRVAEVSGDEVVGTPIWRLFMDPYIAVCSGALVMANVSLAFLEPTITMWLKDNMPGITEQEIGMVWLPAFIPHVFGVYATIVLMRKYPRHPWVLAAIGLALEGVACIGLPFSGSYYAVAFWLCIICFGVALIDTSLLPMLGYLVDTRHVSVYGSVYAIADISYSTAYAFGPVVAGEIMGATTFVTLNVVIAVSNLLYCPMLAILRKVYVYRPFEGETVEGGANEYDAINNVTNDYYGGDEYGKATDAQTRMLATEKGQYEYGKDNVKQIGIPANIGVKK